MATSSELNQFLEYVDEKVLECTICFKRLQNPKSLNCLHSFCLACLEDWVKTKGKLTCPTCSKTYAIPKGGLQKLPPNTFLNNLFEAIEQIAKRDQIKCVCGKQQATYYCQECRHYLCKTCSDCHKVFPALANHKLRTVEDVGSMTPQDFALLHPPLCSLHNKSLEFYCTDCTTPICINCTLMEHKVWEGKHKAISISEAFQTFKETSTKLEESAQHCKKKLEDDLQSVSCNATTFEQSKNTCLRDIDNHVQTMMKTVKENGDKMKNEVEEMYEIYTATSDAHMDELRTIISDINTKLSFLKQLLKSNDATAMHSSETVITALKDRINELPKTKPSDSRQINFSINQQQVASLLERDIGIITQPKLVEEKSVTEGHQNKCFSSVDERCEEKYSTYATCDQSELVEDILVTEGNQNQCFTSFSPPAIPAIPAESVDMKSYRNRPRIYRERIKTPPAVDEEKVFTYAKCGIQDAYWEEGFTNERTTSISAARSKIPNQKYSRADQIEVPLFCHRKKYGKKTLKK